MPLEFEVGEEVVYMDEYVTIDRIVPCKGGPAKVYFHNRWDSHGSADEDELSKKQPRPARTATPKKFKASMDKVNAKHGAALRKLAGTPPRDPGAKGEPGPVGMSRAEEVMYAAANHIGYDRDPPDYGDLMTVAKFLSAVRAGAFIDYDGTGHPVKDGRMSRKDIYPSRVNEIPDDATHILWFNR